MTNLEKLQSAFAESIGVAESELKDDFSYGFGKWDSVAHMKLIAAIESKFDIMIDTEDVIDMNSFGKAKEIVTKYEIQF